jgi:hypothetical protein
MVTRLEEPAGCDFVLVYCEGVTKISLVMFDTVVLRSVTCVCKFVMSELSA